MNQNKNYGKKLVIVGCGGVFNAEDAYTKIKLGASLVQMITGMIFEGPQVIGEINKGLVDYLKKDGYKNIKEAIGANNNFIGYKSTSSASNTFTQSFIPV